MKDKKPVSYAQMIIGREYEDDKLHSYWIAEKVIPDGMVMKNKKSGVCFDATPKTCRMQFYEPD